MSTKEDKRAAASRAINYQIYLAERLKSIERELCGVQTLKERRRLAQEYIEAYDEATRI